MQRHLGSRWMGDVAPAVIARRYRALGADGPSGDLRRAHGVGMEGHFWRFTDADSGRVIVALCGVSRAPDGCWGNVSLAGHPNGFVRHLDVASAGADESMLGVWAGDRSFLAGPDRVRVDLGPDARLDVRLRDRHDWPGRPFGGCGIAHLVPGLGQYWHPHVLGGQADGTAVLGEDVIELRGARVYAEKNWGRGGFPTSWHWGQAHDFVRPDVCVAFAGGQVDIGPLTVPATAMIVRLGDQLIRLGNPVLAPVRAEADGEHWAMSGRGPLWSVELEGTAVPAGAHILNAPLPLERRSVPAAMEHLAASVRVVVRRRGRICFAGDSALAGLEVGLPHPAGAVADTV